MLWLLFGTPCAVLLLFGQEKCRAAIMNYLCVHNNETETMCRLQEVASPRDWTSHVTWPHPPPPPHCLQLSAWTTVRKTCPQVRRQKGVLSLPGYTETNQEKRQIRELQQQIKERDEQIRDLHHQLQVSDSQVREKDAVVTARHEEIQQLRQQF